MSLVPLFSAILANPGSTWHVHISGLEQDDHEQPRHPDPGSGDRQPHPRQGGRGRRLRPCQRPASGESEPLSDRPLGLAGAGRRRRHRRARPRRAAGRRRQARALSRAVHAAIFEARPDVIAVVHAHAEDTLAFGVAGATKLRPVVHSGAFIGPEVPVWDIADNFGETNLLVTNMAQGRDLAKCLGGNNVALMRGHGFAAASRSLIEVVRMSVYLPRNARALIRAKQLGGRITYLSQGEIDARNRGYSPYSTETWRAWEYWANKAGVGHLLTRPED